MVGQRDFVCCPKTHDCGPTKGLLLACASNSVRHLVVDYLTQAGWMSATQLYESSLTDYSPIGVEGVFSSEQVIQGVGILNEIRVRATA